MTLTAVEVRHQGLGTDAYDEQVADTVRRALAHEAEAVLWARARLVRRAGRTAPESRHVVQVTVALPQRVLRVESAGPTFDEAIHEAGQALEEQVRREGRDWESIRGHRATRPDPLVPLARAHVARRTSVPSLRLTVLDAAFELQARHDEFLLFVDEGTGHEAVIGVTGIVTTTRSRPEPGTLVAPELDEEQAVRRLVASDQRYLVFRLPGRDALQVAYRRRHGEVGLIAHA